MLLLVGLLSSTPKNSNTVKGGTGDTVAEPSAAATALPAPSIAELKPSKAKPLLLGTGAPGAAGSKVLVWAWDRLAVPKVNAAAPNSVSDSFLAQIPVNMISVTPSNSMSIEMNV